LGGDGGPWDGVGGGGGGGRKLTDRQLLFIVQNEKIIL